MFLRVVLATVVLAVFATSAPAADEHVNDSATLLKLFANPPKQYSTAPLWVWNDRMTEDQVRSTLADLAGQKVKQVFVHPRPGLMTPYLSAEWFKLWKVALAEAERLDMNVWIYDENSYPSGFAGGFVPQEMPESRGRGIDFKVVDKLGDVSDALGVWRLEGDKATFLPTESSSRLPGGSLSANERRPVATANGPARQAEPTSGEEPKATYLIATLARAQNSPWHGDRCYVDLLYPGVTEKFLDTTLGPYQREVGGQFGRRVPGCFTDEPHIRPAGGWPWTADLPEQFKKRFGYELTPNLVSLVRPVGEYKKVRFHYFLLLNDLFVERWGKPYYERCSKLGLEFTGHYWDHEWPDCRRVPDNMAMAAWQHRPGIDMLMNQYKEEVRGQFGNLRIPKELGSVANQLGRRRTLCEAYGAAGWELRFEDMKRIGDWLCVHGVNTLDEHLSFPTLRGARKWDHPQSFSYHTPWWPAYHKMADYLTRLQLVASAGEEVNEVLVLQPTTTAWMYQAWDSKEDQAKLKALGKDFFDFIMLLSRAQVEYDIGSEQIIAAHGRILKHYLKVGEGTYGTVIIPPGTENLRGEVVSLLETFVRQSGTVICCGAPPTLVDGLPNDRLQRLAAARTWERKQAAKVWQAMVRQSRTSVDLRDVKLAEMYGTSDPQQPNVFHMRRALTDDCDLVLVVNTSIQSPATTVLYSKYRDVCELDLHSGRTQGRLGKIRNGILETSCHLPPCGSAVFLFGKRQPIHLSNRQPQAVPNVGKVSVGRIAPNVLTLDYFDVAAGGETRRNLHVAKAAEFAFQKNGFGRNPWDKSVQFKDELIAKKFPPESSASATYRFTIEKEVPKGLAIVIEDADRYEISCNGKLVRPAQGHAPHPRPLSPDQRDRVGARGEGRKEWWLDRCFGKIDLVDTAKVGVNEVTITRKPFTIDCELMAAYVLGEFSLKPAESGFVIAPPEPLKLGPWNEQGLPFFAEGAAYTQTFDVPAGAKPDTRYQVRLGHWYGSVAAVKVNGKLVDHIGWAPWTCDVTGAIKPGKNEIEVTVIGTLRNTLGPHHSGDGVGTAWPRMFHQGPETGPPPGKQYTTLGYGLFEAFALERVK